MKDEESRQIHRHDSLSFLMADGDADSCVAPCVSRRCPFFSLTSPSRFLFTVVVYCLPAIPTLHGACCGAPLESGGE